jgi:hypothetical protein
MNQEELRRRLLFILHRGFVETRLLGQAQKHQQVFDLADALETIPGYLDVWEERYLESIRFNLKTYRQKYPGSFDYLRYLDVDAPPGRFDLRSS